MCVCVYGFEQLAKAKDAGSTLKQKAHTHTHAKKIDKYTNGLVVKTFTIHFPISSNNAKHKHNKWFCYMDHGNRHFMWLLVFVDCLVALE